MGIGRRLLVVLAVAGAMALTVAAAASARLVADYRFDGDLSSSVAGAPDAFAAGVGTSFATEPVAGCQRSTFTFPEGEGVAFSTKDLIDDGPYTLTVQARFETVTDYVRVINWYPSFSEDNGLYLYNGRLDFYDDNDVESDHLGSTAVAPGKFAELTVSRDASSLVRGYVNGVPQFTYTDAFNVGVSPHPVGNVYFFVDNNLGGSGGEESAGSVARIRLYDSALPRAQIINTVGCFNSRCGGAAVTLTGDNRDNVLEGGQGRDVIAGLGGNDTIRGLGGRDIICGGKGGDRLIGGAGRDRLIGGAGRDRLIGGKGRDSCHGGPGRDARKGCELGRG